MNQNSGMKMAESLVEKRIIVNRKSSVLHLQSQSTIHQQVSFLSKPKTPYPQITSTTDSTLRDTVSK